MSDSLHRMDWSPFWLSLRVAGVATVFALVAGIALGWLFARGASPAAPSSKLSACCRSCCRRP